MIATVTPVKFYVSVLPEDYEDWNFFAVTVQYRGHGKWGVYKGAYESNSMPECLGRWGQSPYTWDYEGSQERENRNWLDAHRFSLDEALKLAKEIAPKICVYSYREKRMIAAEEIATRRS